MSRRTCYFVAAIGCVLGLALPRAGAQPLLSDNFDSYPDQASFQAAWPVLTGAGGTLSTAQAASPPNSISFGTTADRNQRTFTRTAPTALAPITFSFSFYDVDATQNPYRQFTDIQDGTAPSTAGQLMAMGLNNNLLNSDGVGPRYMARILGFNGGAFFKLDDPGSVPRSTGWHTLSEVISPTQTQFFVDGILSKTVVFTIPATVAYDTSRLGSGLTSTFGAFFDNVSVSVSAVPEPSTLALAGVGAAGLLVRRARRKT